MKPCYVRHASPFGRGALHVLELLGPGSREVLARVFTSKHGVPRDRACYGRFVAASGATIDDGMVIPRPDESAEFILTVHGNPLLVAELCEALAAAGASEAPPITFPTAWAFPAAGASRIWREALDLLPGVRTLAAAELLLEQGQPEEATGLAGWAEAAVQGSPPPTLAELRAIRARGPAARGLLEPKRVVLAGVPNAGKSTLFNYLLGGERVVIDAAAGTTRDVIEEPAVIGAYPILLSDGAGLRGAGDELEREGVLRMREAIARADLVVFLEPPNASAESRAEERRIRDRCAMLKVYSRSDERRGAAGSAAPALADGIAVSVLAGKGLHALEAGILRALFGAEDPPRGVPAPFLPRHEAILAAAEAEMGAGAPPRALAALTEPD